MKDENFPLSLRKLALKIYTIKSNRKVIEIKPEDLRKAFKTIREVYGQGNFYLSTIEGTDLKEDGKIRLDYFINVFSDNTYLVFRTYVSRENPEIDSLLPVIPSAFAGECETYDLLGVKFRENPYLKRPFFVPKDLVERGVFPLRKDSGV